MASITINPNVTASGAVPTPPATLRAALLAAVAAQQPGYTANLPGSLIEDISSTDVGAMAMIDQARVDAINAIALVANPYLVVLLGQQLGIAQGLPTNTSVDVEFSGSVGFVIPAGFVVSDGTYQYVTQEGTVVGAGGSSAIVTAIANQSGSWSVPASSVTTVVTSVPSPYTLTVTNPQAGTPGAAAETIESYQARVLQAQKAAGVGTIDYLYTLIQAVSGVVPRLVNVLQYGSSWKVLVGGGDAYAVANAIFLGMSDISRLTGSGTPSRNITVSLVYPPNTYSVVFINPPEQVITGTATWNTNLPNFTAGAQVNSLAAPALASYINSIQQGQPINEDVMITAFQDAVASVLPASNLTTLTFTVLINGVTTPPNAGTVIIPGDAESYFSAAANAFTVAQG